MSSKIAIIDTQVDQRRDASSRPRSVRGAIRKLFRIFHHDHDGDTYKRNPHPHEASIAINKRMSLSDTPVIFADQSMVHHGLSDVMEEGSKASARLQPTDHEPLTPPATPQLLPSPRLGDNTQYIRHELSPGDQDFNGQNVEPLQQTMEKNPSTSPLTSPPSRKKKKKQGATSLTPSSCPGTPASPRFDSSWSLQPQMPPPTGSLPPLPPNRRPNSQRTTSNTSIPSEVGTLHKRDLVSDHLPNPELILPLLTENTAPLPGVLEAPQTHHDQYLPLSSRALLPQELKSEDKRLNPSANQSLSTGISISLAEKQELQTSSHGLMPPTATNRRSRDSRIYPQKPSVVIVPGCFAGESMYESLISTLRGYGYNVKFAALSSILPPNTPVEERPPAATLDDDVSCVRHILTELADGGKDILLYGHGYGAFIGSEACRSLTKLDRTARGKRGGVIRLLYVAGFCPRIGQTLTDLVVGMPRSLAEENTMILEGSYFSVNCEPCGPLIIHGQSHEEAVAIVRQHMGYHSIHTFGCKATFPAWQELPVSWVITLNDGINPFSFQLEQIERLQKEMREEITLYKCESAHHGNITEPDNLVRIVRIVAEEIEDDG